MTMPTDQQILSKEAVQEIESQLDRLLSTLTFGEPAQGNRYVESVDGDYYFEEHADNEFETFDLLRRVPALCQTVRALRQALRDHGEHESHCKSNERYPSPKCDCVLAPYLDHQGD